MRGFSFAATACAALVSVAVLAPWTAAAQVKLNVGVSNPVMPAGEKDTNHIRISLKGFELPKSEERPPVNVAIVIDTSGSMGGSKIDQARRAAVAAVQRLSDDDIVSVVLYNSSASVLVPATKATDRSDIIRKIRSINAEGSTALFAGVSKGAAEARKFLSSDSVNRVILLSDGLANVGPKSPRELERLGASLVKEGISVSTLGLGLGYNEDLMAGLASAASGNHIFIEDADDMVAVFNSEFDDLMSAVASDFKINARVAEGIRPVRVLGTKADIVGRDVYVPLAQLYAKQDRYFVLEVEVPAGEDESKRPLVDVSVQYHNLLTQTVDKLTSSLEVRFSSDVAVVEKEQDCETNAFCEIQLANERNRQATALRDLGKIAEARALLEGNGRVLSSVVRRAKEQNLGAKVIADLELNILLNEGQAATIESDRNWAYGRKAMIEGQSANQAQQSYPVKVPPASRSKR